MSKAKKGLKYISLWSEKNEDMKLKSKAQHHFATGMCSWRKGNVFSSVCLSVCPSMGNT